MTPALVLFLAAAVVPAFLGRIQSAPLWLALQALALGWLNLTAHGPLSAHAVAAGVEVLLVRGLLAPRWLRGALARRAEPNTELMPSNLFIWALAMALLVLAFQFGAPHLGIGQATLPGHQQALTLGVVAAVAALALLLLATNPAPPAQLVALLFLENALALFETLMPHPWPLPVHLALGGVYLLSAGVGAWLLGVPEAAPALEADA